jgi:hypothetical protein
MNHREIREERTEEPVKEIWSRLSYFESKHNSKQYLDGKFQTANDELTDTANSLAFTMSTAHEYYEAAQRVTILTRPLLIFYGMTALAKVLFMATHGKKSPSNNHGLGKADNWNSVFEELTVEIRRDGTFPQFHGCFNKESLAGTKFSIKELSSLVPEMKVEFEEVLKEKSRTLKIEHSDYGINIVDTEIEDYKNLVTQLFRITGFQDKYAHPQVIGKKISLWSKNHEIDNFITRTISGEEYLSLPIEQNGRLLVIPEMSFHYLIMYLLGMLSRYQPEEWGKTIKGEESGEIYFIRKFLDITARKFPNLILNELHNRDFVFIGTRLEAEKKLSTKQLDEIAEYTNGYIGEKMRRRM